MPLIVLNKPYRVLSQFRDGDGRATLASFVHTPSVYPAGRLDFDSEGLLLLTNDGSLQAAICQPRSKVAKTYWAQVEGRASAEQLSELLDGVVLRDGRARALSACRCAEPAWLWPRQPPIRERKLIPDSWLTITIDEGRNRQVRRMTAAVGLPTLRLIRTAIGPWQLDGLAPGETRSLGNTEARSMLEGYRSSGSLNPARR